MHSDWSEVVLKTPESVRFIPFTIGFVYGLEFLSLFREFTSFALHSARVVLMWLQTWAHTHPFWLQEMSAVLSRFSVSLSFKLLTDSYWYHQQLLALNNCEMICSTVFNNTIGYKWFQFDPDNVRPLATDSVLPSLGCSLQPSPEQKLCASVLWSRLWGEGVLGMWLFIECSLSNNCVGGWGGHGSRLECGVH